MYTHTLTRQSKTLWSEGLQAHRVVIHSRCASPLVPHQSLSSHVLHCHDIHARPCQSCLAVWRSSSELMCQVHEGWESRENVFLFFWFLKPLHFLFHSNSPLLAQSLSSSLIITPHLSAIFFFFNSFLRLRSAWFLCFLQLHHFHSNALVQSSISPPLTSPFFPPAYLWSRCSFPSRSPTLRSPGFSSPGGPETLHMKTPVQVVHTRAYLYQWFINTRVERKWMRNLVHFQ